MKIQWTKYAVVLVALAFSFAAEAGKEKGEVSDFNWGYFWGHDGTYVAELDLNPLGFPRIEAMAFVLHRNGTVNFISEHESGELSTAGVGVWERLGRKEIGVGIMMYRMSEPAALVICANIMVADPANCVLKVGTKVTRTSYGVYSGTALLTIEGPAIPGEDKIIAPIPVELPFTMRRVDLSEFPGAF